MHPISEEVAHIEYPPSHAHITESNVQHHAPAVRSSCVAPCRAKAAFNATVHRTRVWRVQAVHQTQSTQVITVCSRCHSAIGAARHTWDAEVDEGNRAAHTEASAKLIQKTNSKMQTVSKNNAVAIERRIVGYLANFVELRRGIIEEA